jgi:hypothetical protein
MLSFESLIDEFCALAGLQDARHVRSGGAVALKDILFSITHDRIAAQDTFFLHIDFGPPPEKREATVYYELLKRNFVLVSGRGAAFTISPVSGHVVYVEQFSLVTARAADLVETIAQMVEQAIDWRSTHFLSGEFMMRLERIDPPEQIAISGR